VGERGGRRFRRRLGSAEGKEQVRPGDEEAAPRQPLVPSLEVIRLVPQRRPDGLCPAQSTGLHADGEEVDLGHEHGVGECGPPPAFDRLFAPLRRLVGLLHLVEHPRVHSQAPAGPAAYELECPGLGEDPLEVGDRLFVAAEASECQADLGPVEEKPGHAAHLASQVPGGMVERHGALEVA
jgi:hypothetical protein